MWVAQLARRSSRASGPAAACGRGVRAPRQIEAFGGRGHQNRRSATGWGWRPSLAPFPVHTHAVAKNRHSTCEVVETILETSRLGVNEVLRHALGVEVKRTSAGRKRLPAAQKRVFAPTGRNGHAKVQDSAFWNPYAPNSPFMNRQKYLENVQQIRSGNGCNAFEVVSEADIEAYVDGLAEDGSLKSFQGMSAVLVPKTLYANVVKVVLRVLQIAVTSVNGQEFLGRELYLLKRTSLRSQWRVSKNYPINEDVVKKLVARVMADHDLWPDVVGKEVQEQMYQNIVTLIFRLVFDLADSCQLRVLGHTISINIEADDNLAEAPGWDISLDSGIFGRFDGVRKRELVSQFVDDLLACESVTLKAMPDVLEKKMYNKVVLLLLDLLETSCNHLRLHLAGISFRPALDIPKHVAAKKGKTLHRVPANGATKR